MLVACSLAGILATKHGHRFSPTLQAAPLTRSLAPGRSLDDVLASEDFTIKFYMVFISDNHGWSFHFSTALVIAIISKNDHVFSQVVVFK